MLVAGSSLVLWEAAIPNRPCQFKYNYKNSRAAVANPSVKLRSFSGRKAYDVLHAYMVKPIYAKQEESLAVAIPY